jgi:hypothetical protein
MCDAMERNGRVALIISFRALFCILPVEGRESIYEYDESGKDWEGSVNYPSKCITLEPGFGWLSC